MRGKNSVYNLDIYFWNIRRYYEELKRVENQYGFCMTNEQFKKLRKTLVTTDNTCLGMIMESARQRYFGEIGNEEERNNREVGTDKVRTDET